MTDDTAALLELGQRLTREVLAPMKRDFIGKDEVIDLLGICLVAGENLFILGPPGTAKSALVHSLGRRLGGGTFDYLLTRFTEPSELFGPFDIRRLREGELVTNTEGMLPEAPMVFLDELLNANSAILNSLLTALNERVFRRGRETRTLRALLFVGASNHLPEDDALRALFDRFLMRVHCGPVPAERLGEVLEAGWRLEGGEMPAVTIGFDELHRLRALIGRVDVGAVRLPYLELVGRLRAAGIIVSDRRAVRLQRMIAASALLCGRREARRSDLWVIRFIWDREEQSEILAELVRHTLEQEPADPRLDHPRAHADGEPDTEALASEIEAMTGEMDAEPPLDDPALARLRDRLGLLDGRSQWVRNTEARDFLTGRVAALWSRLAGVAGG
jgi:MoxR-like ATPase